MYACIVAPAEGLLDLAQSFSPVVEQTSPGIVVFDASGLERLHGLPQDIAATIARRTGPHARIALADNPDAAIHAARGFTGISVIPRGDEAKFLAPLPLALLDPPEEIAGILTRWGLRRFRDLAALPEHGLIERLGEEGLRLHRLARGVFERPLRPVEEPLVFAAELDLDDPVDLLEPLCFLLARLLNEIGARLQEHGLATDELRLSLKLEDGALHKRTLRLPVPALDGKAFLKLLQLELGAHPPQAAVVKVRLEAHPAEPRAAQSGLFIPIAPEPVKLELTLARLSNLLGEANVGSAELLDTHRPGAFRMVKFGSQPSGATAPSSTLALRCFRPPRPAHVEISAGQPAFLYAGDIRGCVTACAGPWRTSGDWWRADAWARDEWDIALQDGALYRLYCERGRWFLEGSYD